MPSEAKQGRCPTCGRRPGEPPKSGMAEFIDPCPDPSHIPASPGDEGQGKRWWVAPSREHPTMGALRITNERPSGYYIEVIPRSEVEALRDDLAELRSPGQIAAAQRDYAKGEQGFYVVNPETDRAVAKVRSYASAQTRLARIESPENGPPAGLVIVEIIHP